jgi:hypothetical protein
LCKAGGILASPREKKSARRSKYVFHAIHVRGLSLFEDDFDDVEAPRDAAGFEQLEPGIRAAFDEFLFAAVHGIERPPDATGPAGFDLDEQQQGTAPRDNIDLTTLGRAVVPIEDFFSLCAEPVAGDALAALSHFLRRPRSAVFMSQAAG